MMHVYKIFRAAEWAAFQAAGETRGSPDDLRDGFVHLSTAAQLDGTVARHFHGEAELVLVTLDAAALGPALRWEVSRGGARFPHLYRDLRIDEVVRAGPLGAAPSPGSAVHGA
jgi:uncharacterized protein (DUF952 family)